MDPAESGRDGRNKNLTLKRFVEQCNSPELNGYMCELNDLYESTGIKCWRNKILAHTDLKTAMGEFDFDLEFTSDDLNRIIECMQHVLDLITEPNTTTDTDVVLPYGGDVDSFLKKLKAGQNAV